MKSFPLATSIFAVLALAGTAGVLSAKVLSYEIHQDGIAAVGDVVEGKSADLVFVDSGYDKNFCTGALCVVERAGVHVAEIVIAESVEDCSVALITSLDANQNVKAGDTVKLKTITF